MNIYHHIGKNFYILCFCLNPDKWYCRILNCNCKFFGYKLSCFCKYFTCYRTYYSFCKCLSCNSVFQCKFLVEFVTSNLCQIISSGIKKHTCNKILGTVHTQWFTRTNLLIQLKKTALVICGSILFITCKNLRFFAKQFVNFSIRSYT